MSETKLERHSAIKDCVKQNKQCFSLSLSFYTCFFFIFSLSKTTMTCQLQKSEGSDILKMLCQIFGRESYKLSFEPLLEKVRQLLVAVK